ncbi:type I-C CRISPR-associated endonuclease Cas1 [Ectothiorhodospiraceae bacterium BW-2]|nr:type I-C CRISPR-associated endonuclease Cas1 [Ectothiorhodospiraceae bacterium BW-2]
MKKLLNTLYITTQGAFIAKEGETLLIRVEKETKLRLPIHTLGAVVCFGQVSASPAAMAFCAEHDILLAFYTEQGKFQARVQGAVSGNVLLRRQQYRWADSETQSATIARAIISGKIANSRTVIGRALRDHPDHAEKQALEQSHLHFKSLLRTIGRDDSLSLDSLRGIEGEAAKRYFAVFDVLIYGDKQHFFFKGRSKRPPLDNVNALLSFVYTLLAHDITAALEGVGLDPAVGYLHRDRPGRAGLALDLMEELRAYLADRLVLSLINRKQVKGSGFNQSESGAVVMDEATRKTVLVAWQERKRETITHPFLDEKVEIGLLPHIQAMLFARYVRGDLDGYPPFIWR